MENQYEEECPKAKMGNYSKSQVLNTGPKKARFDPKVKKSLSLFFGLPVPKELNPMVQQLPDQNGWRRIKGVMDSGASESVSHPDLCPDYEVQPSAGSKIGQKYVSASGDEIENLGEQILDVVADDGVEGTARYQSADVQRPLKNKVQVKSYLFATSVPC